jgi:hypothetical protein
MPDTNQAEEWVDIDEAIRLTGRTRKTLMLWKKGGRVEAKTEETAFTQRQRRTLFRKSDLPQSDNS